MKTDPLFDRLEQLNDREELLLSPYATKSNAAVRRKTDNKIGYRQQFAIDADRILHSRAYTRYIDKTQVFSLIKNDHITHRVLHVQLVARIARTIGRFLHLNEDLIEAIALGHDIGHPPFGHDGERQLSKLCKEHGLPSFQHNVQSVRFLDRLEKRGNGWNLTMQTLDGILCHDGESRFKRLIPERLTTFAEFDLKLQQKSDDSKFKATPATLEGCVVRIADTIAYLGRDIEDAITLGVIKREDLPTECTKVLGNTNGSIVYGLVTDLISASNVPMGSEEGEAYIDFSPAMSEVMYRLKSFNYKDIYHRPELKVDMPLVEECYRALFEHYLERLKDGDEIEQLFFDNRVIEQQEAITVRDFIAGMTDDFFLSQAEKIGCKVPVKRTLMPTPPEKF